MLKQILLYGVAIAVLALLLPPLASAQSSSWLYTVRPGDILWDLCEKYSLKKVQCWRELAQYNGVNYPKKMLPGSLVRFPVPWLKQQEVSVRVSYVRGKVTVRQAKDSATKALQH